MTYRQTSGTVIGNELKDLRRVLTKPHQLHPQDSSVAKKNFHPTTVVEIPAATISRDDPIDVAVLKFMSTHKGYTPDEIHYGLVDKVSDPKMVRPTLFALNNNGYFDSNIIMVAGQSKTIYTLKRGRSHHDLTTDVRRPSIGIKKFKVPDGPVTARMVQISLSDGIDLAVYKLLSDRKWYSRNDVMEILAPFGFNASDVKKRFITLGYGKRNWFERQDTGTILNYRLRAGIKQPAIGEVVPEDETVFLGNYEDLHVGEPVAEAVAVEAVEAAIEDITAVSHCPQPGDSVDVAIWKVMSDYNAYSAPDVQVLLEEYPYNQKTVAVKMSKLFALGWFDRTQPEGKRAFHYTLRRDIPMPQAAAKLTPIELAAIALAKRDEADIQAVHAALATQAEQAVAAPAAEQTTTNAVSDKEHEVMSATASPLLSVVTKNEPVVAPMLDVAITMRGIAITLTEFGQLYKELRSQGFQAGGVKKSALIETKYAIKGTEFTHDELNELVGKMSDLGLQFSKAVTI